MSKLGDALAKIGEQYEARQESKHFIRDVSAPRSVDEDAVSSTPIVTRKVSMLLNKPQGRY